MAAVGSRCDEMLGYAGLTADTHNFKAHATDLAGNVGADSAVATWTIDLSPPDAPTIDAPADGAQVTTARPSFTGHAEEGAAVELFADGVSGLRPQTRLRAPGRSRPEARSPRESFR